MSQALVLNASFQPLTVVPARRAVVLLLKNKADVVESNGAIFRSEELEVHAPSVIRLRQMVKVPYRVMPLTRRAIFARDNWECQYCGKDAENIDHVIPKSKGGPHNWNNVVASCKPCNDKKDDKKPEDVGLKLRKKPHAPSGNVWLTMRQQSPGEWEQYLVR